MCQRVHCVGVSERAQKESDDQDETARGHFTLEPAYLLKTSEVGLTFYELSYRK